MGKLFITDVNIREIKKRIENGEKVGKVLEEYGISRQAYYQRLNKLGLKAMPRTRQGKIDDIDMENIKEITTIYELAASLSLSFEEVHAISKNNKGIKAEIARLNHLANNNPEKFKNEIFLLILKHFNVQPLALIELLKTKEEK